MSTERYWLLAEEDLRDMLEQARHGEPVAIVLAEAYANAEVEQNMDPGV